MRRAGSIAPLLAALLVMLAPGRALPQPEPEPHPGAAPPGSEIRVYLVTMGPGAAVWERFGHNAIWIDDPSVQPDTAYNYGLFDFGQENFLLRFIRGQMWYWMAGFPAEPYIRTYLQDNRSVWLQELNLPPRARLELRDFLRWNELPENRFYHYDYYRDNCSTRIRDAIDRVTGGAIADQTAFRPTGRSYRFHTQRLTANDPLVFTGLLLALGQGVDRPISAWEEMFLPMALREQRVWGLKEKLFERVLPRLSPTTLENLLHGAHMVDGIVKGLKAPGWPTDGWQALQRLAMQLCTACTVTPSIQSPRAKIAP